MNRNSPISNLHQNPSAALAQPSHGREVFESGHDRPSATLVQRRLDRQSTPSVVQGQTDRRQAYRKKGKKPAEYDDTFAAFISQANKRLMSLDQESGENSSKVAGHNNHGRIGEDLFSDYINRAKMKIIRTTSPPGIIRSPRDDPLDLDETEHRLQELLSIHDQSTELPTEIQNFLHPCLLVLKFLSRSVVFNCNLCFEPGSGSSYHCEECDFHMHVECARKLTTMKSEGEELIQHFSHWHPLQRLLQEDQVPCFICQGLGSTGATAYGCKQCQFFLHNNCMTSISPRMDHSFHPCPLILRASPFIFTCGGCDECGSFLSFSCGRCSFQLDVKCALLPTVKSQDAEQIQHFSHQHPLALLCENIINGSEVRCRACEEICSGPTFGCSRCNFFFHKSCLAELPEETHHPFHPQHPLTLSSISPKNSEYGCDACGFNVKSLLAYRCYKCEFSLHKDCSKLKSSVEYELHQHLLTRIDKTEGILCDICHKKASNFCLRCVECRFSIHLTCHPKVPTTINHKCHCTHPLTLTSSPFEFELNSPEDETNMEDEFYCDVCEEKRDKASQVYYCATCKFIAETRCVISELLPFLTNSNDQRAKSRRAIPISPEDVLAMLDREIAKLSEKEKLLKLEIEEKKATLGELEAELQKMKDIKKAGVNEKLLRKILRKLK